MRQALRSSKKLLFIFILLFAITTTTGQLLGCSSIQEQESQVDTKKLALSSNPQENANENPKDLQDKEISRLRNEGPAQSPEIRQNFSSPSVPMASKGNFSPVEKIDKPFPSEKRKETEPKVDDTHISKENLQKKEEIQSQQSPEVQENLPEAEPEIAAEVEASTVMFIGNANTRKFHKLGCSSINQMADRNKVDLYSREEALQKSFIPCKRCYP